MTDRLDQIEQQQAANTEAIAQTNAALNVLITEFIRPNAQQARANFERLERIEIDLEATEQQTARNAEAISNNAQAIAANERRFENLLNEMRADRAESRQRFEAMQSNIQTLLLELTRTNRRVGEMERAS